MLLTNIQPYDLLSWCFYRGWVETDIWNRIFAEKFPIIFKVCVSADRSGEGVSQMWTGVEREGEEVTNY